MAAYPLSGEAVLVRVEIFSDEEHIGKDVKGHDADRDQEGLEESLRPNPDDGGSSLFVAPFHLLNRSQDVVRRIQVLVEATRKILFILFVRLC